MPRADINKWFSQQFDLIEIVRSMMPRGIQKNLHSIVEMKSEFTLTNNLTVIMLFDDGDKNYYLAKCFKVPLITREIDILSFIARVATEMYYVRRG